MFKLLLFIIKPFYRLLYRPKIKGKENLPKKGAYVLVCNHFAKIDALMAVDLVNKKINFMAKKEWFKGKFKNWLFRSLGAIPVDREKPDFASIKACLKVLKDDKPLVVFPEGTRNKVNAELQDIHGGASLIAFKAGVPIIPVGMNKKFKKFGKNCVYIGKPYSLDEFKNEKFTSELSDEFTAIMREKMNESINEAQKMEAEGKRK